MSQRLSQMPTRKRAYVDDRVSRKVARTTKYTKKTGFKSAASVKGINVMHPYAHYQSFNVTGAAHSGFVISANDVYDPEYAIGGGQPYYRDQYAAMYGRYFVKACTADIRCVTDGVKDGMARYVCVWTDTVPWTVGGNNKSVKERCMARGGKIARVQCDYIGDHGVVRIGGMTTKLLKKGLEDEDVAPPSGSSPGTLWYINVVVIDDQVGGLTKPVYIEAMIKFHTQWFSPVDPGQS